MSDISVVAPNDAVMAKPAEIGQMQNWVEASFGLGKQSKVDLLLMPTEMPFSFTYGGKPSFELMPTWNNTVERKEEKDRTRVISHWTDPESGLQVTAEVIAFKQYPAVDWLLRFENTGKADTPIIENVNACDVQLATSSKPAILHRLQGDACGESSFAPYDTIISPGDKIDMAPVGGRSSNTTAFPFFNFECDGQGMIAAIGWSGQWCAEFDRTDNSTRFTAGMEQIHLTLHPGEAIRSPRIVLLHWTGSLTDAQNRFRRLVLFHYCPKIDGKLITLPIALQNFDRYIKRPGWATEAGQIESAKAAAEMGCDTYWFDAGWFPGDFPNGIGNWFPKPVEFPHGLKPLGDECKKLGLKFVLWFEPERVHEGTMIYNDHPDLYMEIGGKDQLFKLGDPAARRWLTDLLSSRISEYGVDIYRNDFNQNPLPFWRENDAPDRQGMTEIRYVEGHYAMWDELREKHPGLWIDNCASGGRRIDIETLSRSIPLWRSDTCCSPNHPVWDQAQNCAIAQYVPLFTGASWNAEAYTSRSIATGGAICEWGYLDDGFSMALAKQSIKEIKATRKYWYGDIYPLTPITIAPDKIIAWQLHRADLDEGMVLAFRRETCPDAAITPKLSGLDSHKTYRVELIDDARAKTVSEVSGKQLAAEIEMKLAKPSSSLLLLYKAE